MRLAFDSDREGERGVYVADRNGENAQRVSGSGYGAVPTWSPDGKRLAFIRGEEDNPPVLEPVDRVLDTGEIRRVTDFTSGQAWGASWFPDGQRICYSHEDRIMVIDVDRGSWRRYGSPVAGSAVRTPADRLTDRASCSRWRAAVRGYSTCNRGRCGGCSTIKPPKNLPGRRMDVAWRSIAAVPGTGASGFMALS